MQIPRTTELFHSLLALIPVATINVRSMNSIYFPAHVVLILRRLVNVVSLSISNQYLLHQQTLPTSDDLPSLKNPKHPLGCWKNVEWPWWTTKSSWDMGLGSIDKIRNSEVPPKSESTDYNSRHLTNIVFRLASH